MSKSFHALDIDYFHRTLRPHLCDSMAPKAWNRAAAGDLNFKVFGHPIQIPLASTILIAVVLMLIGKFI